MRERVWESPAEAPGLAGMGHLSTEGQGRGSRVQALRGAAPREARRGGSGGRGGSKERICKCPEGQRDGPWLNADPRIRSGPKIHRLPFPTEHLSPISQNHT